ncbi:MAG: formate dehydrogenase accessory sulfurtransferase FdhD [Methanotrichaceae archaeon]
MLFLGRFANILLIALEAIANASSLRPETRGHCDSRRSGPAKKSAKLWRRTGATHTSIICDLDEKILAPYEDVSRSSSVDKSVGRHFWREWIYPGAP